MINMQSTFDLTSFKSINAPTIGAYGITNFLFPNGEKLFGKTFYAIFAGKIYGLKILAWALGGSSAYPSRIYLIQTPTFKKWTNLADTPLFTRGGNTKIGAGVKHRVRICVPYLLNR